MPQDPYAEFQIPTSSPYAEFQAPKQQLGPPPGVPRPPNPIEQDIQYRATAPTAGLPGGSINPQPATDTMGKIAGAGIGAGALAAVGPGALLSAGRAAVPFLAAEGINMARKKLGAAGKFIPPGAEMLPFLVGGGKKVPVAEAEGETVASEEAAASQGAPSSVSVPPTGTFQRGGPPVSPTASAPVQAPPRIPRAPITTGAEPDIEMEMRGAVSNPPTTQIKGVPDKLGTPEQIERIRNSMESRDAAKKALEIGKGEAVEKQLVGPDPYASKSAPKMESVQSTNVNKIGHDGKNMWVEYKSGQVYRYKDVPEDVFNKAKDADSVGSFLAKNVKGRFETALKGTARK